MDNYAIMTQAAAQRFCTYDMEALAKRYGVSDENTHLATTFLGQAVLVSKTTGAVTFADGREGNFGESLTIYDWLCDRRENAAAAYDFCPITSLPGIFVRGNGLMMNGNALAAKVDKDPERFLRACAQMGGREVPMGDIGVEIMAFPDLPVRLKFYHSDEEFPATMTLLWDKNILQFIRYETIYYLAGCLLRTLEKQLA